MARFARIIAGVVQEIINDTPEIPLSQRFHPDIVAQCVPCDNTVGPNDIYDGTTFTKPIPKPNDPVLTPQQMAQYVANNSNDPVAVYLRGLTIVLANRFGLTPQQVLTAIINAAT